MSGNPSEGEISWYFNEQKIRVANDRYMISRDRLFIRRPSEGIVGNYTCRVDNGVSGYECESPYELGKQTTLNYYDGFCKDPFLNIGV